MTRFQVVADYLLKIPIHTTSCKFVKGTFINTQWQMKFYDFVCVFICVFKIFTHQNFQIERKKMKFHFTCDSNPATKQTEKNFWKICEGKKTNFQNQSDFLYEKF